MVGNVLGNRYEVIERIGTGGMSLVYRARDLTLNRLVAVKILKHQWAEDEEVVRRFDQEARAAASLVDRHIVQVYDVGREEPNVHYMVMELVSGESLRTTIDREAPMAPQRAMEIADQVAQGLEIAHERGLVHRDIKPHNVLITESGDVKVTDFGIAYAATSGTLVNTGSLLGTAQYLSPEQARGKLARPQSDLYSLGIVLFEMLTGKLPFQSDSAIGLAIQHLQDEAPRIDSFRPDVPKAVADVVERALSKDPAERYQSARALRQDVQRFLHPDPHETAPLPSEQATPAESPVPARRSAASAAGRVKKRRRWLTYLIVAVILGLLAESGNYAFNRWLHPPVVSVPNVHGKTVAQAKSMLGERHLSAVVAGHKTPSAHIGRNRVVSENPSPGTRLKSGQSVTLVLSSGPLNKVVPSVYKESASSAKSKLKHLGFKVHVQPVASSLAQGKVARQHPKGGNDEPVGSTVTLYVSNGSGAASAVMPNLIGLTVSQANNQLQGTNLMLGTPTGRWSTQKPNTIMNQTPAPYSPLNGVTAISISVSDGPSPPSKTLPKNTSKRPITIPSTAPPKSVLKVVVTDQAGNKEVFYQRVNPGDVVPISVVWYGSSGQLLWYLNGQMQNSQTLTPAAPTSSPSGSSSPVSPSSPAPSSPSPSSPSPPSSSSSPSGGNG